MLPAIKRFPRPNGVTCIVDTTSGERVVRYEREGKPATRQGKPAAEAKPKPPKKEPRRIAPKRTGAAKQISQTSGYRPRVNRTDCAAGQPERTDETTYQTNCSCGEKQVTVYDCELFGRCAPTARGELTDKSVRKCADCKSYAPR